MELIYEQIISKEDVKRISDASNDLKDLTEGSVDRFDVLYDITARMFNKVFYGQLFNKSTGEFNSDVNNGDKAGIQMAMAYAILKQINEFTFFDFFSYSIKDNVDGANAEIEAYEPETLREAFGFTISQIIVETDFYSYVKHNDARFITTSDPTLFLRKTTWETWLAETFDPLVVKVNDIESRLDDIIAGNSNTRNTAISNKEQETLSGASTSQQGANIEFKEAIENHEERIEDIESTINKIVLRLGRATNTTLTNISAGVNYDIPFEYFIGSDGLPIMNEAGTGYALSNDYFETTDFITFSMKEGLTIEAGTTIEIPYFLTFSLSGVAGPDLGSITITETFDTTTSTAIDTLTLKNGQTIEIANGTYRRVLSASQSSYSFKLSAKADGGSFLAAVSQFTKLELLINNLIGIPEDIKNYVDTELNKKQDKLLPINYHYELTTGNGEYSELIIDNSTGKYSDGLELTFFVSNPTSPNSIQDAFLTGLITDLHKTADTRINKTYPNSDATTLYMYSTPNTGRIHAGILDVANGKELRLNLIGRFDPTDIIFKQGTATKEIKGVK